MVQGMRLRVQPCRSEPPSEPRGIHAGQLRLCIHLAWHPEETRQQVSRNAQQLSAGFSDRPIWQLGIRPQQEGGRGFVPGLQQGNRSESAGLSLPKPLRQVVPPELQLGRGHLLQRLRQRPALHGERPER